MQDELKKVISQAMDASSKFEQEPIAQLAEGELSDEALEVVAGGILTPCRFWTAPLPPCKFQTWVYPKA